MSIAALTNVLKAIRGEAAPVDERLYKEVLLMTLARASRSDADIHPVEVDTIRSLWTEVTGEKLTAADVRIAAASEIYETTSLDRCLARVRNKLSAAQRATILQSLAKVIKSDTDVTAREAAFFDMIADALGAKPSELAGLAVTD